MAIGGKRAALLMTADATGRTPGGILDITHDFQIRASYSDSLLLLGSGLLADTIPAILD